MPRVLHILPHPGGGGEVLLDLVSRLERYEHERFYLSASQSAWRGAPSVAVRRLGLRRRSEAADMVHVIGDMAAMLTLSAIRRRPAVFGTHGLHSLRRSSGLRGSLARRRISAVVQAATRTICTSQAEFDEIGALGGSSTLVHVRNGVPLPDLSREPRAEARAELELEDEQMAVLYLGRLERRKDPLLAVEAAERAARRGARIVLLVAGDGPLADEIAHRAGAVVHPLGFRDDPDRLLAASDVLVMPSSREGLSLAVLEAMAHGVAPVVSDGPGNPDAVGEAGLVFPAGDVGALEDSLVRLTADDAERQRLGRAARDRAEREFSLDRFLADMERVFEAVLATGPARGDAGVRA